MVYTCIGEREVMSRNSTCLTEVSYSSVAFLLGAFIICAQLVCSVQRVIHCDTLPVPDPSKWILQPPINAIGPIPSNGEWKTDGGAIVATGTSAPWTGMTAGESSWTDYKLSVRVTIRKPAPRADFPIFHAEYDRYLSRADFPPLCEHTGQYRYRFYAGEFDWGSDAAVLVRYLDRGQCYRVQLSTEYQEIILWHGMGGYLQVVPCKLEAGRAYKLDVLAQGSHLQVLLDGKKVIDYWHDCLPTFAGGIGLAANNSTVAFQDMKVTQLPPAKSGPPPHQPRFASRLWRGLRWIFDGNEPILLMEPDPNKLGGDYTSNVMMFHFVKLRPGYRPLYYTFVGARKNDTLTTKSLRDVRDIKTAGEGTERLTFQFDGATSDKSMLSRHTDTLTFDRVRGSYRHDLDVDIEFPAEQSVYALEFADPLTYNNKEPGRGVKYRWLPAGHQWGVFINEDGGMVRHPISQSLDLDKQNNWTTQKGHSFWMLYPDRAVCPVWEHDISDEPTYIGVCHWGLAPVLPLAQQSTHLQSGRAFQDSLHAHRLSPRRRRATVPSIHSPPADRAARATGREAQLSRDPQRLRLPGIRSRRNVLRSTAQCESSLCRLAVPGRLLGGS